MKFEIMKSHEMISCTLIGMALLSEWKHVSSTKCCNLSQITLDELYNKSHERFVLSKYQENTPIGLKLYFKFYLVTSLTIVKL
jgi:hypothetical protein